MGISKFAQKLQGKPRTYWTKNGCSTGNGAGFRASVVNSTQRMRTSRGFTSTEPRSDRTLRTGLLALLRTERSNATNGAELWKRNLGAELSPWQTPSVRGTGLVFHREWNLLVDPELVVLGCRHPVYKWLVVVQCVGLVDDFPLPICPISRPLIHQTHFTSDVFCSNRFQGTGGSERSTDCTDPGKKEPSDRDLHKATACAIPSSQCLPWFAGFTIMDHGAARSRWHHASR